MRARPSMQILACLGLAAGSLLPACQRPELGSGMPEATCSSCHGGAANAAPPSDLDGSQLTTARGVGAHQRHLLAGVLRGPLPCEECHVVPDAVEAPGHVDALPAELTWGPLARAAGAAPAWDREGERCAGTYCHGGTLPGGRRTRPIWTQVDGSQTQCDSCHGHPPPPPHPARASCQDCHPDTLTAGGEIDLAKGKHLDGQLDVGGVACSACHGDPQSAAPPVDLEGRADTAFRGVGAHRPHLAASDWHAALACGECHQVPTRLDAPGHYDTPPPAELTWGPLATAQGATPAFSGTSCSGVYCHAATYEGAGGTSPVPVWTQVDGSQGACGACHSLPPGDPHPQNPSCEGCHTRAIGAGRVWLDPGRHIDGQVEAFRGHPAGYADPLVHGQDALLGVQDCRGCHGPDLGGGSAGTSCDGCHPAGWRTDCTFCHGGADNATGAPPEDLRNRLPRALQTVGAHSEHVSRTNHPAYACAQCHTTPAMLLAAGHMFDATPGVSEVRLAGGLSPAGSYAAPACNNLYCHGTGRANRGVASFTATISDCRACHPGAGSSEAQIEAMSGEHHQHIWDEGAACAACHSQVVSGSTQIANPDLHVNGQKDVSVPGLTYSGGRCTGLCHGQNHTNDPWL